MSNVGPFYSDLSVIKLKIIMASSILCYQRHCDLGQYHGCWCPGSLCHQVISSHGICYIKNLAFHVFYWKGFLFLLPTQCEEMIGKSFFPKTKFSMAKFEICALTHRGRVTHIYASLRYATISSYNGLSPDQRQAIIWTNAGMLLTGPSGTNFWKFIRNYNIFIQENMFGSVIRETAAILPWPQCVNKQTEQKKKSNTMNSQLTICPYFPPLWYVSSPPWRISRSHPHQNHDENETLPILKNTAESYLYQHVYRDQESTTI